MSVLNNLLIKKMAVISWKDRMASAIPTSSGTYVLGSFPSLESAENMNRSFSILKNINDELIEYHVALAHSDPLDYQAVDEAVYLTAQNKTLDKKIFELDILIALMQDM